jgi:CRP/FNR family transcriptional regulator, cyclic AMP receptor protein
VTELEALQRSPLFRDFSESGVRIFADLAQRKVLPAGTPLFVENTAGESLFIVTSGTVRVTQRVGDADAELGLLGAGEHLGELSLLGRCVRLVSATAATPCEVLELTRRDYLEKAREKPAACLKLALAIAGDLGAKVSDSREALRALPGRKPGDAGPDMR